jgi:diguanylate cyclase (GGDEF)-like protein
MADGGWWRWARSWSLWQLPTPAVAYVLTVETAAVAAAVAIATAAPIGSEDLLAFTVLAACSVVHLQASRRIERVRRVTTGGPQVDLTSIWLVAAVCCLPPLLVLGMVVLTRGQRWLAFDRPAHRNWFSAAAITLSACAASGVLLAAGHRPPPMTDVPGSLAELAVLAAVSIVYWVAQVLLVGGAIALTTTRPRLVDLVGDLELNAIDVATVCLGVLVSIALTHAPLVILFGVPVAVVLHRAILVRQFENDARQDAKTGLANTVHWRQIARKELTTAGRRSEGVGVLIIDLDHFKNLNDRYGHLAGDDVLRAVADALRAEVPDFDFVARFGGEEFSILVPGVHSQTSLLHTGDRIRRTLERLSVAVTGDQGDTAVVGVTASVGAAMFPDHALNLDDLLRTADTALYAAKRSGRNRTCLAVGLRTRSA